MKGKVIFILTFLCLFTIIVVQNNQNIPFRILFWSFDVPKVILIPLLFVLGFLFGFSVAWAGRKPRTNKAAPTPGPEKA
jgi:uncharacterized integral membrane protein